MKKRELLLEGLPKPGEPLEASISASNRQILQEDLEARIDMMTAKLTPREQKRLIRRYRQLQRQLRRAKYNELIAARHSIFERYKTLRAELTSPDADIERVKAEGRAVATLGKQLNEQISAVQPFADEFQLIQHRLKAHEDILLFEKQDAENRDAFLREKITWERQIKSVFKQSPRLHWRGTNKRGKEVTKIPKIDHVFFKLDYVYYRIKTSSQSPIEKFFGQWHSALPYGVDVDSLADEKTLKNMSAATGRKVEFEASKVGVSIFYKISRFDTTDGIPDKLMFGKAIEWYPTEDHYKTPWPAGVTVDRVVRFFNFEDQPHVLIAGSTQSGKSNLVNQMLACIVTTNTPDDVRVLLIDNKGGIEFTHWDGISHSLAPMIKKAELVLPTLKTVRGYLDKRLEAFEAVKAKNLLSYNRKVKDADRLPRIIVFIDEMATLLGIDETEDIQGELRVLVSQGRAVGIHLVICTQHVSVDILPGWIKTNMTLRISGKMPSHGPSLVILDTVNAALLPSIPGRMIFSVGRDEIIAQTPYITDQDIEKAVAVSRLMPLPAGTTESLQLAKPPRRRFDFDDLVRIALTELNGAMRVADIHEIAGGNKIVTLAQVKEMVTDLYEREDPIIYEGKAYEVYKVRKMRVLRPVGSQVAALNSAAD